MGRLTLNVLLSFAQFERELASERVRDKVAASMKKGKWTGGSVPLGYEAKDKKLVINKAEAETLRTIFRLYLELKSFGRLVAELDRRKIVTKRRNTKSAKFQGGIPFTYGPLAYFLKNRIYLGEMHHGGKWFKGEHEAILDRPTFDQVQDLLKSNRVTRRIKHSESRALLQGKLFDDKGNPMGPTFSSKNGVRYRFYVSTALRGRKQKAGSVTRISAPEVETLVEAEVRHRLGNDDTSTAEPFAHIARVTIFANKLKITLRGATRNEAPIESAWVLTPKGQTQGPSPSSGPITDPKLIRAMIRARVWLTQLSTNYTSIEGLAAAAGHHPKVVRQGLRLAFLAPELASAALRGDARIRLNQIPKLLPLGWREQCQEIG